MKASFSTKSQKNGVVFKPLIATSLALALGISVGNASNEKPNITLNSGTSNELNIYWLGDNNYYKISHDNGSALDNFSFYLENNGNTTIDTNKSSYTAHISTSINSLMLSTTSNGIQMGESGTGTLTIGGGNKSDGQSKTMTLNLHNLLDPNHYALKGNLSIDNWQTGSTTATIGGSGIKGNVTLKAVAGTNIFTFNKNAGIEGGLILKSGNHNITFGKNTDPSTTSTSYTPKITGDIQATGGNTTIKGLVTLEGNISSNKGANTTTIFQGNSSIKGSISLNSEDSITIKTNNHIIFNGNSATIGADDKKTNVTTTFTLHNSGASWQHTGSNAIISNTSNNTFKIENFRMDGNYGGANPESQTFNIITLNNDSASNTVSIDTMHSLHGNNVIGKNLITTNNSNSTFTYDSELFGSNTPTIQNNFSANFADSSHTAKGNFTIGSISTEEGKNYINVENLTITKNISAIGGENLIVTPNLTFDSTSNITAGRGGYGARNVFDIENVGFGNSLVIKADNTTNQNTNKHNIFKISGNITANQTIQELTAITGKSHHNRTINILSFESDTNSSNSLTINGINKTSTINDKATGYNYIGKALTQGEGLGTNLNPNFAKSWSSEKYQANLTLNIDHEIYAKGGKNYINVKTINANTITANNGGGNYIAFGGNSQVSGSIMGNGINTFVYTTGNTTLTLKGTTNQISTLTAFPTIDDNPSQNNTLTLDSTNNIITANINTLENGNNLKIDFNGASGKSITLTLNSFGSTDAKLRSVGVSSGTDNTLAFNQSATIIDPINSTSVGSNKGLTLQVNSGATLHAQSGIDRRDGGDINVRLNHGTLTFGKNTNHISNLSGNGVINLSSHTPNALQVSQTTTDNKGLRNSLTIESFTSGETTFRLYASSTQNDRVIFNGGSNGAKAIITLVGEKDIHDITYSNHLDTNNTLVAQTKSNLGMIVEGGESLIGIDRIRIELIPITEGSTTNYYVGKVVDLGVDPVFQDMSNTALMINYDLFLANFNSLNKRMGELRDNANNHGIWGRVFGGSTSNSFGAGSTTNYITTQVGYDYSIDVGENARNYTGIALAYGSSTTKSKALNITASTSLINTISLDNIKSNVIELGLYNAYVADNGWYNDTIFKFNYLMSEFSMSNNSSLTSKINNFALILSDEFGYRYKFAENEKGNWFIDPQLEVAVGYFNQSDFVRTVFDYSSDLYAYQDAIFTLRTRIGASLGKKFNTEKGFATLYAGAFYEHDYIKGGASESKGGGSQMIAQLESIHSNDRAIVNVGSNIELTEGARLYIDVEKSFGEKHRTHMQFNLGARYSF